jgi:hypothetical protein
MRTSLFPIFTEGIDYFTGVQVKTWLYKYTFVEINTHFIDVKQHVLPLQARYQLTSVFKHDRR